MNSLSYGRSVVTREGKNPFNLLAFKCWSSPQALSLSVLLVLLGGLDHSHTLLHICVPVTPGGMDVAWLPSFVYPTVSLTPALRCLTGPFLSSGPSSQAWFFSCPHPSNGAAVPGYRNRKHSQLLPVILTHSIKAREFCCPSYCKKSSTIITSSLV